MSEYIKREDAIRAVIKMVSPYFELEDAAFRAFEDIPGIRFTDCNLIRENGITYCSNCRTVILPPVNKFCPGCGGEFETNQN